MSEHATPVRMVTGDVALIAGGKEHWLLDDPRSTAVPYREALARMKARRASEGPRSPLQTTVLLCAEYQFDSDGPHSLVSCLPELILLTADTARHDSSLQTLVRLLLNEAGGSLRGSELVVPRLVDSLLVLIVRSWLETAPSAGAGWFGALRDPQIGRAIALIHSAPERPWTVATLASEVGHSRAAFARRFAVLVGEAPLAYVTQWRMSLAAKLLKTTLDPVDAIAGRVGYESPTAFGKAFRRHLKASPGRYRAMNAAHTSGL